MPKLDEMRAELRELRKGAVKPISKMKKDDIAVELESLRRMREQTPAPAATPSVMPRQMKPAVESVKEAKAHMFPVAPAAKAKMEKKPKAEKAPKMEAVPKKKSKMDRLMELAAAMSDTEEE